ncbi:MAG: 4-hydroxy-tetrahydrodipicolinate reductase [Deltaproteobacteria bacterium GWC2_42_11]|nr:MAG: 4-hydroxy-tetrahydrodipicolinate reductase [Deltaproteobacteria bacterium GWC2_42_11]HBO83514.1 4-hydroxy-tetrahydrodipicolinate reductase [Deltaproteobacteria bacterium]
MIKIIVAGALGRMGTSIINVIKETEGVFLAGALEMPDHPAIGKDLSEFLNFGRKGVRITDDIEGIVKDADCIIDFSHPEASIDNLEIAVKDKKAIVIGTTGFSHQQRDRIKELSQKTRVVLAPNMSVGVNLLLKVISDVARVLGKDYDVEIIEAHHRLKKDAPSGTAMRIAEVIADALNRDLDKVAVYERKGIIGERKRDEIGIQTVRAGDIVGDHTIIFGGLGERLEITHRAHSRDTFARGAVRAAVWIVKQKDGIYDMQDVLGLKR